MDRSVSSVRGWLRAAVAVAVLTSALATAVTPANAAPQLDSPPTGPWISIATGGGSVREFTTAPVLQPGVSIAQRVDDESISSCTASWPVTSSLIGLGFMTAGHCDVTSGAPLWIYTTPDMKEKLNLLPLTDTISGEGRAGAVIDAAVAPLSRGQISSHQYSLRLARGVYLRGLLTESEVRTLPEGTPMCMVGGRTGVSCGPLLGSDDEAITWGGRALHGDSGSAVFVVNSAGDAMAVGMLKSGPTPTLNKVVYLEPALKRLDLRLVIDAE